MEGREDWKGGGGEMEGREEQKEGGRNVGIVAHTYDLSTQEAEPEGSPRVEGQPDYIVNLRST